VPKHPATKARFAEVEHDEMKFDVGKLIRYGIENATEEEIHLSKMSATVD
jgi:hypothetical protein